MQPELRQLEQYLDQVLGAHIDVAPWPGRTRLAPFLRERYGFWETAVLGNPCLLIVDKGKQEQAAAVIRKHVAQIQAKWPAEVVYVRGRMTSYNRKRLIEHKVPFVVPGNQMYLPMAGLDLREHFRRQIEPPTRLSPATQVVVLHWLLKGTDEPLIPAHIANQLGYSAMTMTRALDELEAHELGEVTRHGKERQLRFAGARRDVWTKAQPLLRSPVTKRLCIHQPQPAPEGVQAGLAALSHYSMLAAPQYRVLAVYGQDWNRLPIWHDKTPIPLQDPEAMEIEVWRYKPNLLANHGVVDPLSLYLSLENDEDERVQSALEEMLRRITW